MQKNLLNQSSSAGISAHSARHLRLARPTRRRVLQLGLASALTLPAWLGLSACAAEPQPSAAQAPAEVNAVADVAAQPTSAPKAVKTAKPTAMPTPIPTKSAAVLPAGPVAPPIESAAWINTKPIAWDSLRGKVVMVEFWTFGCINCQHVIPSMKAYHADYKDRGFTLVSVHSPEFDYEKQLPNVKDAVKQWGIEYPVAQDNDFANWNRYRNRYWPALYLVDKRGVVRFTHIGEGGEPETRQWIEALLAE